MLVDSQGFFLFQNETTKLVSFWSLKKGLAMKRTVFGILAHVDAGKTTLSEAMLYCSALSAPWGVDHARLSGHLFH
jgi:hypothetical protein